MLSRNRVRLIGLSAFVIAAYACVLSARPVADGPPSSHFPNIELITQDGKKVHFYDDLIKGKIVAIAFIYTTCGYQCPLETARMAQVQKKLGVYSDPSINADGHLPHLLIGNDLTNTWIRGSAVDNPNFQARMIGDFLDNFKHANLAEQQKHSGDGSPIQNFDRGRYLFGRDCLACHTIGHGDKIGPDLLGVTRVRDRQWLTRMVQTPEQLLNGKDPIAMALLKKYNNVPMPNVSVSNDEMNYLISYIEAQTAARDNEAGAASPARQ